VLLGRRYEAGIGAQASLCEAVLAVDAEVGATAGRGVSLKFAAKEDCAEFVARLVAGQASRGDLSACSGITTLAQVGASVKVGAAVDVGKATGMEVLQVSATAEAGTGIRREVSVGLDGRTITTSQSVALRASLTMGIDKDAIQTRIGGTQEEEVEVEDDDEDEEEGAATFCPVPARRWASRSTNRNSPPLSPAHWA
jgi:hypothetical protein